MPPQDPNAQVMTEQAPGTNITSSGPAPPSYAQMLEDLMRRQQNLTGMTHMAPAGTATPPASRQTSPGERQQVQQFGPGGRGAAQRQDTQNIAIGAHNLAQQIGQRVEAKKLRDFTQVTDNFMKTVAGLNQAQAQIQDAQKKLKENPNDQQAQQMLQQGQQALQINQTNLEDMVHDSKKHKIITKAFGIDDKNAGSPERQAAIASIRKTQGVGQQSANILSRLPQTQQLSPEAQAQASAVKAGVVGKPQNLNPNTVLQSMTRLNAQSMSDLTKTTVAKMQTDERAEAAAAKAGLDTTKLIANLPAKGLMAVTDENGKPLRNEDGTLVLRNLTQEELMGNPELAEKYRKTQADINYRTAAAKAATERVAVAWAREKRLAEDSQELRKAAQDPNYMASWAKNLSDPSSGVTLAQVPSKMRGPIVDYMANKGLKISKPLTGDEIKRADLAGNAVKNIEEAQSILKRRPDMFGPAGFGKTKYELALSGGDPDAIKFQSAITLANLPAVGIHGVRGKWAIEDLAKLDGNLYLNKDSMTGVLDEIHRSASEFRASGGREPSLGGPSEGPTDEEILKGLDALPKE